MKKLSLILVAVLIAALAGCAGDTNEPGGTLTTVSGLELDATTAGRTIVLTWAAISDDLDGYEVYFKADATGSWVVLGESTTTTYTHNATNAGTYAVRAYKDTDFSENYSNEVSTMPYVATGTFTIYDNYSASTAHSGFIFYSNGTYGITGLAGDTNFEQDLYAYDDSPTKGDVDVSFYSGNQGTYPNGNQSYFQLPAPSAYGSCDPSGSWGGVSLELLTTDSVIFVKLPYSGGQNAYAKIYAMNITADTTPNGTIVSFSFEYQSEDMGLSVFTSNAN